MWVRSTEATCNSTITVWTRIQTRPALCSRACTRIELYQAIRDYAQDLCNYAKWFLGAITTYLLPVAYALLGAFLYAFRSFARRAPEQETASLLDRNSRFLMAAIAGIAISLFSSLIPQSMPLSPLALAFLVGYSIEVFTSRLDELVRRLTRKP